MADQAYLQWNLPNWITVLLMTAIGMAVIGFVASAIRTRRNGNADS